MPVFSHRLIAHARRRIDPRWRGRGLVLLYHRVAAPALDPQRLAGPPDVFAQQLDVICREGDPMPLDVLVERARLGTLPRRAVAITFDDGYADVLHAAAPLLAARRIPATVFVTADAIKAGEFWWDAVARHVLDPHADAGWHVERPAVTGQQRIYLDLCARLRTQPAKARDRALEGLGKAPSRESIAGDQRPMTPSELSRLATAGIAVGSHTRSHGSLASLPADEQFEEIRLGRAEVEGWIGTSTSLFAYPFGGAADVSSAVVETARRAGMTLACTTEPGRVGTRTDPRRVPRITIRNWSADEFRSRFSAWMAAS